MSTGMRISRFAIVTLLLSSPVWAIAQTETMAPQLSDGRGTVDIVLSEGKPPVCYGTICDEKAIRLKLNMAALRTPQPVVAIAIPRGNESPYIKKEVDFLLNDAKESGMTDVEVLQESDKYTGHFVVVRSYHNEPTPLRVENSEYRPARIDAAYQQAHPVQFPESAIDARHQGKVLVLVTIDKAGHAKDARFLVGSGFPELDAAAVDAARNWKYFPATKSGIAEQESQAIVPVVFAIHQN